MTDKIFSPMELDAIGEVMNISLGSSATAVSNLLDHRVEITTPTVSVCNVDEFVLGDLEPAVGVEIRYVSGLEGSNIMLLKRSDVKAIVDILMGYETPEEEFELNELTISAVCEVMNQMMGAASTALSDFLGFPVNISTPESFELNDFDGFKKEHFPMQDGICVAVRFQLKIEGVIESQFINVMSTKLTRELLHCLGVDGGDVIPPNDLTVPQNEPEPDSSSKALSQEEIERLIHGGAEPTPQPTPEPSGGTLSQEEIERLIHGGAEPTPQPTPEPSGGTLSQEEIERLMQGAASPEPQAVPQMPPQTAMPNPSQPPQGGAVPYPAYPMPPYGQYMSGYYPPPGYYPPATPAAPPDPKIVNAKAVELPHLANGEALSEQQSDNLDMLMSVPLEISVEIGRTHKKVQDILSYTKGSLVVLDKLAGDQVDLFVNGQCIARGDVVVIDDNFGIRITEVLNTPDPGKLVKG